jgi:hypothetical protein
MFYSVSPVIDPVLGLGLKMSSVSSLLDWVSFRLYKMRLGIAINKGYSKKKK